jgi:hypothetical protein
MFDKILQRGDGEDGGSVVVDVDDDNFGGDGAIRRQFWQQSPFRSTVVMVYRLSTLWSFISASEHHEIRPGPYL